MFSSPLFRPIAPWLSDSVVSAPPTRATVNAWAKARLQDSYRLKFVIPPVVRRSYQDQYEVRCHQFGEVAYREDCWHDAFNALAWFAFPETKRAISQAHFSELETWRLNNNWGLDDVFIQPNARGARRDALTLFDEGGVIVTSDHPTLLDMKIGRAPV